MIAKNILLGRLSRAYSAFLGGVAVFGAIMTTAEADAQPFRNQHAVIMQYHHVSESTPPSTSLTPDQFEGHLKFLEEKGFQVIPLTELVNTLKSGGSFSSDKVVSITFDDNGKSICTTAWPMLQKRNWPFTVFINTDLMHEESNILCSWDELREIQKSGLLTVGNHTVHHPHLLILRNLETFSGWRERVISEIVDAQKEIDKEMGEQPKYLAYPYGEYNKEVEQIAGSLGYVGFGQQSGAVGVDSNFLALPRFPLSGTYSAMDTMETKMMSLAFPIDNVVATPNPIFSSGSDNPPHMMIRFKQEFKRPVECFLGTGQPINIDKTDYSVTIRNTAAFNIGRGRYNCTSPSTEEGRFYWYSHQWQILPDAVDQYLQYQWFDFSRSMGW